jgi:fibrillarin-like pre-rRNA processing protein
MREIFPKVFKIKRQIATENLVPGSSVYGEKRIGEGRTEYRLWDPYKSKLAAAIANGLKNMPVREGDTVLYLGIAQGTTASHISDIVGEKGLVIGVEISPKPFEKLLELCEERKNIIPILGDANRPEDYREFVEKADIIYQDIAQKNQGEILLKNARAYLKKSGYAIIVIKARSIDVVREASEIFKNEIKILEKEMGVLEIVSLRPYDKDHILAILRLKQH